MLLTPNFLLDFLIFLITAGIALYLYLIKDHDYWKKRGIPYIKPVPFFGNMMDIFTSQKVVGMLFKDFYKQMKTSYLGVFLMHQPAFITTDLNLIKNILHKDFNNFCDRPFGAGKNSFGGKMFSFMKGDEWRLFRRKLGPHFSKIKSNFELIHEIGEELVQYLDKESAKNEIVNIKFVGTLYGAEAMTTLGLGCKADCFSNENSSITKHVRKLFDMDSVIRLFSQSAYFLFPSLVKYFKLNLLDPQSEQFIYGLFENTYEMRKKTQMKRSDFVEALMKIQKEDKDIDLSTNIIMGSQTLAFFIGGLESTSLLISVSLYELAKNPDKQTILRDHINDVLANSPDGKFTHNMVTNDLKYVLMVVKECLRKYPPLPQLSREAQEDYPVPGTNYVIEKGTPVIIPIFGIQMDPKYFPNPEEFIPERFSKENVDNIVPHTYMPFGDGLRMCPGEKIALVNNVLAIAMIIKNFEVSLRDESQKIMDFCRKSTVLVPTPR